MEARQDALHEGLHGSESMRQSLRLLAARGARWFVTMKVRSRLLVRPPRLDRSLRWGFLLGVGCGVFAAGEPADEAGFREAESESESIFAILRRRDSLAGRGERSLAPEWFEAWRGWRIERTDRFGIDLTWSCAALWQAAVGGGDERTASSGDFTCGGNWTMFGAKQDRPLSLNFRFRHRQAWALRSPAELGRELGANWGTTNGFNDRGFEVPDFFMRQFIGSRDLELRYGQLSVENQLDRHALRGASQSFLNRAFSTNPAVAFPRFGAGATMQWAPSGGWDFTVAITQVQASNSGDQVDFQIDSSALFYGVQGGWSFDGWGGDPARLQALCWYADPVREAGRSSGHGISLTVEQQFEEEGIRAFARFAHAADEATDAAKLVALGIGQTRREFDLLGLGLAAGDSSATGNWQGVLECFYRRQISSEFHITPSMQLLVGNGFEGGGGLRLIPGVRGRLAF